MTASARRQLRDKFAGEELQPVGELTDTQLALRLDAIRASNGSAFTRPTRNKILQEAAGRLRNRKDTDR